MIFQQNRINAFTLSKIIGEPLKLNFKDIKPVGSARYKLLSFEDKTDAKESLKVNSRCNFQIYTKGLLLWSNFVQKTVALPIAYEDLIKIELIRGEEEISPFELSLMKILLWYEVPLLKARYFRWSSREYSISDTRLNLETQKYTLLLSTSGYQFESQQKFFENLDQENKIEFIS